MTDTPRGSAAHIMPPFGTPPGWQRQVPLWIHLLVGLPCVAVFVFIGWLVFDAH